MVQVAEVAQAALASCPKLKTIIYSNHQCEPGSPAPAQVPGLRIVSFEEVVELGKGSSVPVAKPSKDAIAVLMYTRWENGSQPNLVSPTPFAFCSPLTLTLTLTPSGQRFSTCVISLPLPPTLQSGF